MASVDIRQLLGKLNPQCVAALHAAASSCRQSTHYEVTVEHMLYHLQNETQSDVAAIYRHFGVAPDRVEKALLRVLQGLRTGNGGMPVFSPLLIQWFEDAFLLSAVDYSLPKIRSGILLLALVLQPSRSSVGDFTDEYEKLRSDELKRELLSIVAGSSEDPLQPETSGVAPPGREAGLTAGAKGEEEALGRFTVDLTERARKGMDSILGRDHEIRQMIDVLTRRRKNNPVVVGEAGVGKTAVVEGFAQRVAAGEVPSSLKGVRVLTLDLGLLQAGAGVKGEFENRLKAVIQEVQAATTPTILFIDEIHTLIGAGGAAGTGDAANLLKPPLARGELRTIGATTLSEYKKYIEKDAALERRFQPLHVDEPSPAVAVTMLRGVKEKFEQHHGVRVLDRAIEAACTLADRYISGRQLPDKAVDVLDTACARVAIGQSAKPGALDDLERKIANLDTAISALEDDAEHSLEDRTEERSKLQVERAETEQKRAELHARWSRELEAVLAIRTLQRELAGAKARSEAPEEGATADEKTAQPLRNPAELREEIEKATRALEAMQGETPLVQLHVGPKVISQVVSDWTGIPAGKMMRDELAQVLALEDRLRERVVGQDQAIEAIARKIRASKAGLQAPNQPIGVFLLVGPSGVGKTEISTAIADLLFGGERFMVTVNMTEFMEKHSISKLIGSPPGYVGYGEGGVLTEAVRHRPYSVVLLDEIEKADPEVMNLFYQVFDKGTLADGEGRIVDFKNTIVMMGSNLASDLIMKTFESDEPPSSEKLIELIRPTLQKWLKPALLGRMTIVPFFPLGPEVMRLITDMKLRRVGKRLEESHGIAFEVSPAARDALARRCTDSESGARNIDHVIDQTILPQISLQLLEQMAAGQMPKRVILAATDEGDFRFDFTTD
jgi:type VI secretion system protein VasG